MTHSLTQSSFIASRDRDTSSHLRWSLRGRPPSREADVIDLEWLARIAGTGFDVLAPGTATEPYPAAVELANRALAMLPELLEASGQYFHDFLDGTKCTIQTTEDDLISVVCSVVDDSVRLELSWDGDTYGLWWIDFSLRQQPIQAIGFWPIAFGRESW